MGMKHHQGGHVGHKSWSPRHATLSRGSANAIERAIETAARQGGRRECDSGYLQYLSEQEEELAYFEGHEDEV